MCGIAGIVMFNDQQVSLHDLKNMTNQMIYRGPDDDGFFVSHSVGLGMRRLSIIDVDGGHQPLSNETGHLQLVLNGEIYNHLELRTQLKKLGHTFKTASDAEVVLHLYEEKGIEALHELNGMFSFALYDDHLKSLWIARDRFGIKPLFYSISQDKLLFASTIHSLKAVMKTNIASSQLVKYLALSYAPNEETVWDNVKKLPPAHYLLIQNKKVSLKKYWDLKHLSTWKDSYQNTCERLEELLKDAIKIQLRSDVPIGVFSSGGIDSSSILALASEQLSSPLKTFTISFNGKGSQDEYFARIMAKRYNSTHTEINMGPHEAYIALNELLPKLDEPLGDSAILPAYWLSKKAREHGIKVLLNGAGGDEIFGGYARHWPSKINTPTWIADNLPNPFKQIVSLIISLIRLDLGKRTSNSAYAWSAAVSGTNLSTARQILCTQTQYHFFLQSILNEYNSLNQHSSANDYIFKRMQLDIQTYLPEDVLALTDKATMAASVEGRVPFLDHRLAEFVFSLSSNTVFLENSPKGLLKNIMSKKIPKELMNRKKEGFNSPDAIWFKTDTTFNLTEELLNTRATLLDDIINPKKLAVLLISPQKRIQSAPMLFNLYLLNRWIKTQQAN